MIYYYEALAYSISGQRDKYFLIAIIKAEHGKNDFH